MNTKNDVVTSSAVKVATPTEDVTRAKPLREGKRLPLVVEAVAPQLSLVDWATSNRDWIERHLRKHGGILFRNFQVGDAAQFERFIGAVSERMMDYQDRATHRRHVSGNIYTATDYPPDHNIYLHNEPSCIFQL